MTHYCQLFYDTIKANYIDRRDNMGNKVETILDNVKLNTGQEMYEKIINECGNLGDKPTPAKQAKYTAIIMDKLSLCCDKSDIEKIMHSCNCLSKGTIEKAKKLYADSLDLTEFLNKLNKEHIGGGNLHIEGNKVIGIYSHCYCGLAKNAKNLPSDYCYCSAGWFQKLFSSVLGRDIEVRKLKTILDGANECTFEIYALS